MKKLVIYLFTLLIGFNLTAGNGNADHIYSYLEQNHNTFSLSFSKKMIDFFDMDVDFNGKEKWITGDFTKGRMLIISEKLESKEIKKMFLEEGFENIDFDPDKIENEDEVSLLVKHQGKNVSEAHFIVEEEENLILVSIYGKIKVRDK